MAAREPWAVEVPGIMAGRKPNPGTYKSYRAHFSASQSLLFEERSLLSRVYRLRNGGSKGRKPALFHFSQLPGAGGRRTDCGNHCRSHGMAF